MPVFRRDTAPVDVRLGDANVLRITLGDVIVWDGTTPVLVEAPPALGSGSMPAPSIAAGVELAAPPLEGAGSVPAAAVGAGVTIDAPAALGTGSVPTPTLGLGVVIDAPPLLGSGSVPTPSAGETVIDAPPLLGSGTLPAPSVSAGFTDTPPPAESVGSMPAPLVGAGVTIDAAAALGTGSVPAPTLVNGLTFSDNFDRANGSLGSNWVTVGSYAPVISSNKVQGGSNGPNNTGTVYAARWTSTLAGDRQSAECTVVTPTGTAALSIGGGVFVRGDGTGNRVELLVTNTAAYIFTRISGTQTQRAAQTSGLTISSGTAIKLTADGTVYSAYLAGSSTPTITWDDTGGLIAIGSGTRNVGVVTIGQKDYFGQASYGYGVDNWTGKDL